MIRVCNNHKNAIDLQTRFVIFSTYLVLTSGTRVVISTVTVILAQQKADSQ